MQTERLTLAHAIAQMTPESVEKWLMSKADMKFVRNECYECVLAVYLTQATRRIITVRDVDAEYDDILEKPVPLPQWAQEFIKAFDGPSTRKTRCSQTQTLRILRECCPGLKGKHIKPECLCRFDAIGECPMHGLRTD